MRLYASTTVRDLAISCAQPVREHVRRMMKIDRRSRTSNDEHVDPVKPVLQRREDSKEGQLCLPAPAETCSLGLGR
jgi:hypothetical protein